MLPAPTASIACCARRVVSLHSARHFSVSRLLEEEPTTLKKPNVTRKKYAELPTVRVLADGTSAPPLGEWTGGIREPVASYENIPSSIPGENSRPSVVQTSETSAESGVLQETEAFPVLPAKVRRKRRVKADTSGTTEKLEETLPTPLSAVKRRKRKTAVQASDADTELAPPTTPLATEVLDNLNRYPHCILLTRVGQFYESYFDQAAEVAQLLNIKLTKKTWGGQRIPMCGFPLMHLNKYLRMLVQGHNRFVAMCEEFPRDISLGARGGFIRRVARIVTPGTLIDEPFLNPYENNFLLSIAFSQRSDHAENPPMSSSFTSPVGLAWIDVSTGEFYTKTTTIAALRDEIVRISPKEVVLDGQFSSDESGTIRQAVLEEGFFLSYFTSSDKPLASLPPESPAQQLISDDLTAQIEMSRQVLPAALSDEERVAVELLTRFMHANLLEHMPSLSEPNREMSSCRMQIDSHTVKALEIRERIREGGTAGSVLSVVKRTVTMSGTRLLARWLCSPSTSVDEINARQALVAFFHSRSFLRQDLVQSLRDAEDATRIVQRFLLGRGTFLDLNAICNTISIWSSIKDRILMEKKMEGRGDDSTGDSEWSSINTLMGRMSDLEGLADRIRAALVQRDFTISETEVGLEGGLPSISPMPVRDPRSPLNVTEWTFRPEFSEKLAMLHTTLKSLLADKDSLERRLQVVFDAPSLTLRASSGQGMHVHVARKREANKLKEDKDFIRLSESGSTCSFFHVGWSQLATQINETAVAISLAEKEAFEMLRNEVIAQAANLRRDARIVDELDVTLAFANLAVEMRFVRPVVTKGASYHVVNGRHPTVELGLLTSGRDFTPNTVTFTPDSQVHVVTGPNMAGKSTLLRQTALIAILAQTGSFVPAESAEIGIVDQVFSRVGAKDDLFRDRSTFMVEMLEASDIMRRATPNSLVIMDEVGRGTTVEDGQAIAFATVHHLLSVNNCRTMFATHFHELADMLAYDSSSHHGQGAFSKVAFFCTSVDEMENGYFSYSHRMSPGVNRDSHGLKVAQLAGMPDSAVTVARSALAWLKKRSAERGDSKLDLQTLGQALALHR